MMRFSITIAVLVLAACGHASEANSELQCQQRIADAREAQPINADPFGASAYEKIGKQGCSTEQLATIVKLHALAANLAKLSDANEAAAASGNEEAHMRAFQDFNGALIQFSERQIAEHSKLKAMQAKAPQ